MIIKKFDDFREANIYSTTKGDIARFDGKLKHKQILDNTGQSYTLWWSEDEEVCASLARLFSGKFAQDLGGYGPSQNDVFLCTKLTLDSTECRCAVLKTNGDNIIPDEVLKQAAAHLKMHFTPKDEEFVEIVFCGKDFVSTRNGKISVDDANKNHVVFTPGNVKIL